MSTQQDVEKVKSGYAALDNYDRKTLREFIEDFEKKPELERKAINEKFNTNVRNKALGPTNSAGCPCCGK